MWKYNYNIYGDDELYHFGVIGMKWGQSKYRNAYASAKSSMKKAKKVMKKAYKYASRRDKSNSAFKTAQAKSNARWIKADMEAARYNDAKDAYKNAKKDLKKDIRINKKRAKVQARVDKAKNKLSRTSQAKDTR